MNANEIIRWWKDIWGKTSSPPAKINDVSRSAMDASEPVGATGMTGATGATGADGHGEVPSG